MEPTKAIEVKKPRAFVAESDLFDFSDMKIVTGGDKIPNASQDKTKASVIESSEPPMKKIASSDKKK